jgi:hypothetical protein
MRYSKGLYCSIITYDVMVGDLLVHNIRFSVDAPFLKRFEKIPDFEEFTGDMRVFVQFGKQRRNLSGQISIRQYSHCKGFTKEALFAGLNRAIDWMQEMTGQTLVEGFSITAFECNKDYGGARLDEASYGRVSCLRKEEFFGVITQVYQKDDQTVRVEQRVCKSLKVQEAVAFLKNPLGNSNLEFGLKQLHDVVDGLRDSVKWQNRGFAEVSREVALIVRDYASDREKVVVLEQVVSKLYGLYLEQVELVRVNSESLRKLSEILVGLFGGLGLAGKDELSNHYSVGSDVVGSSSPSYIS